MIRTEYQISDFHGLSRLTHYRIGEPVRYHIGHQACLHRREVNAASRDPWINVTHMEYIAYIARNDRWYDMPAQEWTIVRYYPMP